MSVLSLLAEYLNPGHCRTNFNPIFFSHGAMIYYLIELNMYRQQHDVLALSSSVSGQSL